MAKKKKKKDVSLKIKGGFGEVLKVVIKDNPKSKKKRKVK